MTWAIVGALLFLAYMVKFMRDGRDCFGNDGGADERVWG